MDYDKTLAIVGEMAAYHPKKAKKISLLLNYWLDATEEEKKALEKEIRDLIVDDFHRSLDRTSRTEYVNCNVNVHEFSYTAEHNVPGWDITTWGANRIAIANGEVKVLETIPRIYKKGYVLPKDASEEAISFSKVNSTQLSSIADYMDRREDIITFKYKPADGINKRYIEHLIDYLGYRRAGDTPNKNNGYQKKIG